MREPGIPLISYFFVGITSVILALVTVLDKSGAQQDNKSAESSTSLLPNIFAAKPATEPITYPSEPIKMGGKKRKTKSNKPNHARSTKKN
jgi:hypothetical protein